MLGKINYLLTIVTLTAIAAAAPLRTQAEDKAPSAPAAEKNKKSPAIPFRGKLAALDKTAMTLTLEGKEKKRLIQLTSQTRITKAGAPATLADVVVGEDVGGQVIRTAEGKEEAISLRLGAKPEAKPKGRKAAKEKPELR